jgi:hypothetical protein
LNSSSTNLENTAAPAQPSSNLPSHAGSEHGGSQHEDLPPVWLQRIFTFVYVLFCMTLGMALVTLPWTSTWFEDGMIARWPAAQQFLQTGFVRGCISGLGFIDIWLGVLEAINYHDRR